MMCGLALTFNAFANVAYDKEYTNEWFSVTAASASLQPTDGWTVPKDGGTVEVKNEKIALDTELTDPLTYKPASTSGNAAIVTATFAATANASVPELTGEAPQAALTVVANGVDTNWYGYVKGTSTNEWVKFDAPVPVVGSEYDITIEFNLTDAKKIRYSVGGTVLGDGWYGNPHSTATCITSVSFAGTGDIGNFKGDNVAQVTPVANITGTSQTDGFDFTNGTLNVALTAGATGTATLKVIDFETGNVIDSYTAKSIEAGAQEFGWEIAKGSSLIPGGTYGYELTITPTDAAQHDPVTKTGTFVAASTTDATWFSADATSGTGAETGGVWESEMTVADNAYVIDDTAKFDVADQSKGSNNLTRVDAKITFDSMVDAESLEVESGALGGFVAATADSVNMWKALTLDNSAAAWVTLTGDIAPQVNTAYVVRAEISFIENNKKVRYLVSTDDGANFTALTYNNEQWLDLADATKGSLAAVELKGSGKLAKLEGNLTDKALAEVGGVKYDNMADALEAGYAITLRTNVTVKPTKAGTWAFLGGFKVEVDISELSGGSYSWNGNQLVVTAGPGTIFKFY